MAILLDMSGVRRVEFAVSPLVELGWAWHVLVAADHHPERASWVSDLRAHLDPALLNDLQAWSFTVRAVRASVFTGVDELPPGEFASAMLRPLSRVRGRPANPADPKVLGLARARGAAVLRVVQMILTEPDAARAAFAGILTRCREAFFDAEWRRIEPGLRAEVAARTRLSDRHGWARAVAGLSQAIAVDGSRIAIDKVQSKRLAVADRGLVVVPTVFGAPHMYVADEPGSPVVVHYPLSTAEPVADSRLTMRRLTALAHPARLEVCRAIAVEPRSAREIARLWGMAEPAVTKHLSVLRAAGLVRTERVGHFVQYTMDGAAVGTLGSDLLEVLRR